MQRGRVRRQGEGRGAAAGEGGGAADGGRILQHHGPASDLTTRSAGRHCLTTQRLRHHHWTVCCVCKESSMHYCRQTQDGPTVKSKSFCSQNNLYYKRCMIVDRDFYTVSVTNTGQRRSDRQQIKLSESQNRQGISNDLKTNLT